MHSVSKYWDFASGLFHVFRFKPAGSDSLFGQGVTKVFVRPESVYHTPPLQVNYIKRHLPA